MSYILESIRETKAFFLCGLILESEEILVVTNQQNDNMSVKICNELHC